MTPAELRALTPEQARALSPDAIALLADLGEAAEEYRSAVRPDPRDYHERQAANNFDAVLARLDTLCGDEREALS